jgi:Coenzyme PQQ synthesis protein D (PqqD)
MHMQVFIRSDSVVSRVIAGETLIIPVRKGVGDLASIYSLNEVGSCVWEALSRPRSKDEIIAIVEHGFEAKPEQIRPDIESFLEEMQLVGILEIVGASAA